MGASGGTVKAIAEGSGGEISSVASTTYVSLATVCPGPVSGTAWLESDPTQAQVKITSMGATLGVDCNGGGYANYLDVDGSGTNIMAMAYGRGWQSAIHQDDYNPTQAGVSDSYGSPASLTVSPSSHGSGNRVTIQPFTMALFENPNFCFDPANFYECGTDTDGIHDSALSTKAQSTSEFTFSAFYQDASALASNTIPVFQSHFSFQYSHDPGSPNNPGATLWDGTPADYSAIYQFGPNAVDAKGAAVHPGPLGTLIGTGQNFTPYPATYIDLARSILEQGVRLALSAGYTNAMYVNSSGSWVTEPLDLTASANVSPALPMIYSSNPRAATLTNAFAVLENPTTGLAVGMYVPQNDPVNSLEIAGTDIATGKQVYQEDRRIEWLMDSSSVIGPATYVLDGVTVEQEFTVLHPVLLFNGLLAPNHSRPGVMESISCDEFLLFGTPAQILTAVKAISTNAAAAGW